MADEKQAVPEDMCRDELEKKQWTSAACDAEEGDLGDVQIDSGVIAIIARAAVLNVKGVSGLHVTFARRIASFFGLSSDISGIRVEMDNQHVSIGTCIVVGHGVRIPDVVRQVQDDVRCGLEGVTGKTVKAVNVVVQSVQTPPKNATEDTI